MARRESKLLEETHWRCSLSPTGAHYWVYSYDDHKWICKYCSSTAWFPREISDAISYGGLLRKVGYETAQVLMESHITREIAIKHFRGFSPTYGRGGNLRILEAAEEWEDI